MAAPTMTGSGKPWGIVDVGSNTVRLVVYRALERVPLPLLNEKVTSALGKGLETTGRLNPEGKPLALRACARYARLRDVLGIETLDMVATAAIRDAEDGPEFVREIEAISGQPLRVLSGAEEAYTAALGVLCGLPRADGLVADLGGGSLELMQIRNGEVFGPSASLAMGLLRLTDASKGNNEKAGRAMAEALAEIDWLDDVGGRRLYAVGGAWRTLAKLCIYLLDYPLHVLDNFSLPTGQAIELADRVAAMTQEEIRAIPGLSEKRLATLPLAAVVMKHLLQATKPDALVFSVSGMREGRFFERLSPEERALDPLIASCERLSTGASRFTFQGRELMSWMSPLFPDETDEDQRLRLAACLMGDAFWDEHPDYRAEQAFHGVIKLPFMGLSHLERAALALMLHYRYSNSEGDDWVIRARALLQGPPLAHARATGQALRLGLSMTAGSYPLLQETQLKVEDGSLVLELKADESAFVPEMFSKRLKTLARGLGLTPVIRTA